MIARTLIVPAAGSGTRLGASVPKLLVPVAGVPMIDRVLDLHAPHVSHAVVVVNPAAEPAVRQHLRRRKRVSLAVQPQPTGMLDAIAIGAATEAAAEAENVWITWCDQVAVHAATISMLTILADHQSAASVILPTVRLTGPYIHFVRDRADRIVGVLQRREGDEMPAEGEGDVGLFSLSHDAATRMLPEYAAAGTRGSATGERNFLPFIPWAAVRGTVLTFPSFHPMDAQGVNTPDDLRRVEDYFASQIG